MKKYSFLLAGLLAFASCSDDVKAPVVNTGAVEVAEVFVDSRDGQEYKCAKIGDQVWMTENLRYILPKGPLDGCYTWDEAKVVAKNLEVSDDDYVKAVTALANDPNYDWNTMYNDKRAQQNMVFYLDFLSYYGQTEHMSLYREMWPEFVEILEKNLEEYKGPAAIEHLKAQEVENGGYSSKYGLLYTFLGAQAAVPQEGGWRLPSDEDWSKLEKALGMPADELEGMETWRGAGIGEFMKNGSLNFTLAGGNLYSPANEDLYIRKDEGGYYWSSTIHEQGELTPEQEADTTLTEEQKKAAKRTTVFGRQFAIYTDKVWRGSFRVNAGYRPVAMSVRLVRDAK